MFATDSQISRELDRQLGEYAKSAASRYRLHEVPRRSGMLLPTREPEIGDASRDADAPTGAANDFLRWHAPDTVTADVAASEPGAARGPSDAGSAHVSDRTGASAQTLAVFGGEEGEIAGDEEGEVDGSQPAEDGTAPPRNATRPARLLPSPGAAPPSRPSHTVEEAGVTRRGGASHGAIRRVNGTHPAWSRPHDARRPRRATREARTSGADDALPATGGAQPARAGAWRMSSMTPSEERLTSPPVDVFATTVRNCRDIHFTWDSGVDACGMCHVVAEADARDQRVCHCYRSPKGTRYYDACEKMLGTLRAKAAAWHEEAEDQKWSEMYRSFGACEFIGHCPGGGQV